MTRLEGLLVAGLLLGGADWAVAQPLRQALNLVTRSEVVIDRPAATVWPHIVDPSGWKQGLAMWHHGGPAGAIGEVFAAGDTANRAAVAFYAEAVELEPARRRTIKLFSPAGQLIGFATWSLREAAGRTTVEYHVYSEFFGVANDAAGREQVAANQRRFDQELLGLKRLVETRSR